MSPGGSPRHEAPAARTPSRPTRARRAARAPNSRATTALIALLCAALGLGIVTQVQRTGGDQSLDSARPADLVTILDNLRQREAVLREDIGTLEGTVRELQDADAGSAAARTDARERAESLAVLVGTVAASGPGLVLDVTDPTGTVGPDVVLDVVQELRAAGAEAIQVESGPSGAVRIGLDSAFTGRAGLVEIDGVRLPPPYAVSVIGDPPTLAAALNIPGGVVDTVKRAGGAVTTTQLDRVDVDTLRAPRTPQYARPAR